MLLHLRPTLNNFFFTFQSTPGRVVFWFSAGQLGLRGPRRSTPLAAEQTARAVVDRLLARRVRRVRVRVVGLLSSRVRAALRGLEYGRRLRVVSLQLVPPLSHNGLRAAKRRRV